MTVVTVAIPVLNGGQVLARTLEAVASQRVNADVELLIADSGSTDGSAALARRHGARVLTVAPGEFSHGATRNGLMEEAAGSHVAFLTQDATPVGERWLAALLSGFELADDVGLVFGPYRPWPEASVSVRRELDSYFAAFSPDGKPVVDRRPTQNGAALLPGRRLTFFSDANGCVARWAWERVPFRPVPYAEDQLLACELLLAGVAKAYVPAAAVWHSHDYGPAEYLRRCFDEWRGLLEVYGHVEPVGLRHTLGGIRLGVRRDRAQLRREGVAGAALDVATLRAMRHHGIRAAGAILGSRADRLPPAVRGRLSLERRSGFAPRRPLSSPRG